MKAFLAILAVVMLGACSRHVKVNTAPAPAPQVTFQVTNGLSQAINVYLTTAGSDVLVGQVPPNSTKALSAAAAPAGVSVSLKARTVDGTRTYTRDDVVLSPSYTWQVP